MQCLVLVFHSDRWTQHTLGNRHKGTKTCLLFSLYCDIWFTIMQLCALMHSIFGLLWSDWHLECKVHCGFSGALFFCCILIHILCIVCTDCLCAVWIQRGLGGTKGRKADTGMEHQIGSTRWHRIVVVDYYYCSYCSWLVHQIVSTVAPYCSSLQFTITIATYCSTPDRWHRTVVRCSWLLLLLLVQLTIVTLTITPDSRSNGTVLLFVAVDYFYCYHYLYCSWLLLMLLLPIAVDFCPLQCIHWTGMKLQIVAVVGPHCAKCNLCTVCNLCTGCSGTTLCTCATCAHYAKWPVQPVHWTQHLIVGAPLCLLQWDSREAWNIHWCVVLTHCIRWDETLDNGRSSGVLYAICI